MLDSRSHLSYSEWIVLGSFFALFVTLAIIANVSSERARESIETYQKTESKKIFVHIAGAVECPGTYEMEGLEKLKIFVEKARPLPEADLTSLDLESRVEEAFSVFIPCKGWIQVRVKGAVKEAKTIRLRVQSKISDLLSYIECTEETDRRFFRKKKALKDGEEVEIPKKKIKKNNFS
ncbi:MAG: hypothetical protein WCP39_04970 [Chlamydiota bacterium]